MVFGLSAATPASSAEVDTQGRGGDDVPSCFINGFFTSFGDEVGVSWWTIRGGCTAAAMADDVEVGGGDARDADRACLEVGS